MADLSPLLAPKHQNLGISPDTTRINSYPELDSFLLKKKDAVFFDYVLGVSPILLKEGALFRALHRNGIRYAAMLASPLPVPSVKNSGVIEKILFRLRSTSGFWRYLADFSAKWVIAALRARGAFYARPWRVYAVNRTDALGFLNRCGLGEELLRPVNSLDYSASIEMRRKGFGPALKKTCVLIDEDLVDSRDFAYAGLKALSESEFCPPINIFLDKIQEELGLEPVIAAHPKVAPGLLEKRYPGRRVIYGDTVRAIAETSLVLAHWSTALNFAVIFNKPALLLKLRAMEEKGLSGFLETLAGALGVRTLRVEDALGAPLDFVPEALPRSGYAAYMERYVKSNDAPEATTWEIIAADLAG